MKIPEKIIIKESNLGNKGLFAKNPIKTGSTIFRFEGRIGTDEETDAESMQIGENEFLESTIGFDNFLNHSCNPNCFVDWPTMNLVANQDIKIGEELTVNYNTFEYDLVNMVQNLAFKCNCGSEECYKEVKGFAFLSYEEKIKLKNTSPFLKTKN
jgi:SET domain-containing protein